MKQDLTQHSDSELSLVVMNDETLYRMRNSRHLKETLQEHFIFTEEQWEGLKSDITNE